jgi:hypothetical protein
MYNACAPESYSKVLFLMLAATIIAATIPSATTPLHAHVQNKQWPHMRTPIN